MTGAPRPVEAADFAAIETWVFDLDNTLYPAGSDLWPKIDQRITQWIMSYYGIDGISARHLQKYYYERYGTTLFGLMAVDNVDPHSFLAFVHDIDRTSIVPDPALVAAVAALPGRKLILTNGSRLHAEKTLDCLGFSGVFEDIFDIVSGNLVPKPDPAAYAGFLRRHDVEPTRAAIFEDIPRNLMVPKQLGMRTVLVTTLVDLSGSREEFEKLGNVIPPHIDHVTNELAVFCGSLGSAGPRLGLERDAGHEGTGLRPSPPRQATVAKDPGVS